LGREAESLVPDFEANFNSHVAAPAKKPNKNRKKNEK
jgi:hypothetical protein